MKQLIAIVIAGIALIFFIAAAGTDDWQHISSGGNTSTFGAFRACKNGKDCITQYPDCTLHGSPCDPNCGTTPQPECNQDRATQGFLVLALLFDAVAIIIMCVVRFGGKEGAAKAVHVLLAVTSVCAIIAFSVYIQYQFPEFAVPSGGPQFKLGAGVALTIVAWLMCMGDIGLWHWATM